MIEGRQDRVQNFLEKQRRAQELQSAVEPTGEDTGEPS